MAKAAPPVTTELEPVDVAGNVPARAADVPAFYDTAGNRLTPSSPAEAEALYTRGEGGFLKGTRVPVIGADGTPWTVPDDELADALKSGAHITTHEDAHRRAVAKSEEGIGGAVKSTIQAFPGLGYATAKLAGAMHGPSGEQYVKEHLAAAEEAHPIVGTAATLIGALAPGAATKVLARGGALATTAGGIGRALSAPTAALESAGAGVGRLAGTLPGIAGRVAAPVARGATIGAGFGAAGAAEHGYLNDDEHLGEHIAASGIVGAALGVATDAALTAYLGRRAAKLAAEHARATEAEERALALAEANAAEGGGPSAPAWPNPRLRQATDLEGAPLPSDMLSRKADERWFKALGPTKGDLTNLGVDRIQREREIGHTLANLKDEVGKPVLDANHDAREIVPILAEQVAKVGPERGAFIDKMTPIVKEAKALPNAREIYYDAVNAIAKEASSGVPMLERRAQNALHQLSGFSEKYGPEAEARIAKATEARNAVIKENADAEAEYASRLAAWEDENRATMAKYAEDIAEVQRKNAEGANLHREILPAARDTELRLRLERQLVEDDIKAGVLTGREAKNALETAKLAEKEAAEALARAETPFKPLPEPKAPPLSERPEKVVLRDVPTEPASIQEPSLRDLKNLQERLADIVYGEKPSGYLTALAPAHAKQLKAIERTIAEHVDNAIDRAARWSDAKRGTKLVGENERSKRLYRDLVQALAIASGQDASQFAGRTASITDHLVALGGASHLSHTGGLFGKAIGGVVGAAVGSAAAGPVGAIGGLYLNHWMRTRGSMAIARALRWAVQRRAGRAAVDKAARVVESRVNTSVDALFAGKKPSAAEDARIVVKDKPTYAQAVAGVRALAGNPRVAEERVASKMVHVAEHAPVAARAATTAAIRAAQYLATQIPHSPTGPSMTPQFDANTVSKADQAKFMRKVEAATHPTEEISRWARGEATPEGMQTLRVVYPNIYRALQEATMRGLTQADAPLTTKQQRSVGQVLDAPPSATHTVQSRRELQVAYQPQTVSAPGLLNQPNMQPYFGTGTGKQKNLPPLPGMLAPPPPKRTPQLRNQLKVAQYTVTPTQRIEGGF